MTTTTKPNRIIPPTGIRELLDEPPLDCDGAFAVGPDEGTAGASFSRLFLLNRQLAEEVATVAAEWTGRTFVVADLEHGSEADTQICPGESA